MKLAVVSTTVHGEKGYLPFDRLAAASPFSKVSFFIAGDKKSGPFDAVSATRRASRAANPSAGTKS
jgi:hypothetical protein